MKSLLPLLFGLACCLPLTNAAAAEWQWSVPVPPLSGREKETPRAFLWVPPDCQQIRGVVFGHHNMQEIAIFEHPIFRQALAELGFAVVWVAPAFDRNFRFDQGAGEKFDAMMAELAAVSGYEELTIAPLVPTGHSAAGCPGMCPTGNRNACSAESPLAANGPMCPIPARRRHSGSTTSIPFLAW